MKLEDLKVGDVVAIRSAFHPATRIPPPTRFYTVSNFEPHTGRFQRQEDGQWMRPEFLLGIVKQVKYNANASRTNRTETEWDRVAERVCTCGCYADQHGRKKLCCNKPCPKFVNRTVARALGLEARQVPQSRILRPDELRVKPLSEEDRTELRRRIQSVNRVLCELWGRYPSMRSALIKTECPFTMWGYLKHELQSQGWIVSESKPDPYIDKRSFTVWPVGLWKDQQAQENKARREAETEVRERAEYARLKAKFETS